MQSTAEAVNWHQLGSIQLQGTITWILQYQVAAWSGWSKPLVHLPVYNSSNRDLTNHLSHQGFSKLLTRKGAPGQWMGVMGGEESWYRRGWELWYWGFNFLLHLSTNSSLKFFKPKKYLWVQCKFEVKIHFRTYFSWSDSDKSTSS